MTTTVRPLPRPSRHHATCAWCNAELSTIVDLLDHVDHAHLDVEALDPPATAMAA